MIDQVQDYQLLVRWQGHPKVEDSWQHLDEFVKSPSPWVKNKILDYFAKKPNCYLPEHLERLNM